MCSGGEKEGYYRTLSVKTDLPEEQGCEFDAEFSGDGRGTVTISTTFIPPCLLKLAIPLSAQQIAIFTILQSLTMLQALVLHPAGISTAVMHVLVS